MPKKPSKNKGTLRNTTDIRSVSFKEEALNPKNANNKPSTDTSASNPSKPLQNRDTRGNLRKGVKLTSKFVKQMLEEEENKEIENPQNEPEINKGCIQLIRLFPHTLE